MGVTWISWRQTIAVIVTILQIRALISVKTTVVTVVEGQSYDFRCDYPQQYTNQSKYFCHVDDNESSSHLIRSEEHNQWKKHQRFALYDNTSGAFFTVRVDRVGSDDSGTYWCGVDVNNMPDHISVIKVNVSRVRAVAPHVPEPQDLYKLSFPLYLTAVVCMAAILFVSVFTFALLLVVKNRRSRSRQNTEVSSDYESMMPGVQTEPQILCQCSDPGCTKLPDLPPPSSFSPSFDPKQRASVNSYNGSDYAEVDVSKCTCQYEHLDPSSRENHVYHSLEENSGSKHEPSTEIIHSG